jgi:hypothetical protein
MKIITCPVPAYDVDIKRVVIRCADGRKLEMTVRLAQEQGYLTYTTDFRGYINEIVSLENEPGFPSGAVSVHAPWIPFEG